MTRTWKSVAEEETFASREAHKKKVTRAQGKSKTECCVWYTWYTTILLYSKETHNEWWKTKVETYESTDRPSNPWLLWLRERERLICLLLMMMLWSALRSKRIYSCRVDGVWAWEHFTTHARLRNATIFLSLRLKFVFNFLSLVDAIPFFFYLFISSWIPFWYIYINKLSYHAKK